MLPLEPGAAPRAAHLRRRRGVGFPGGDAGGLHFPQQLAVTLAEIAVLFGLLLVVQLLSQAILLVRAHDGCRSLPIRMTYSVLCRA